MKSRFVVRVAVLAAMAFLAAVPALSQVSVGVEVRIGPPPPPRYERMVRAPYRDAVWVRGHWAWDGHAGRYIWMSGHWVPVRSGYFWTDGQWLRGKRGWVWREGHWKARGNGHYKHGHQYEWTAREAGQGHDRDLDRYNEKDNGPRRGGRRR